MITLPRSLATVFALLALITSNSAVNAAGGSSLSSALQQSSTENALSVQQVEFLKVDEAFKFNSNSTSQGLKLNWKIAEQYYLYKERFKFKIISDDPTIQPPAPDKNQETSVTKLGEPVFSQQGTPEDDPYFGRVHIIQDNLEVFLPVTLGTGESEAEIKISYQGCAKAGLCYPPKHQKILFIPNNEPSAGVSNAKAINASTLSSASTTKPEPNSKAYDSPSDSSLDNAAGVFSFLERSNLLSIIGIFFLLGLGLTFTPCVFPMIPIITSIIAGQEKPTPGRSALLAIAYILGMAITYALAGVLTGLLGAGANVQAALQDPILLSIFATIFVLLALSMFGLYELQLPAFIRDKLNDTSQSLSGGHLTSVFFIGALSALVVSPCVSAPLAGALLYISSTGDALIGGTSLLALGLGMGLPLFIIAVGGGKFLPKAGAWMDRIKQVFGIMLIAVAIWLINRALPASIGLVLWSILLFVSATQLGAFESASTGWKKTFKGLGLILALYAAMLLIGALSGSSNPLQPLDKLTQGINSQGQTAKVNDKLGFTTIYSLEELDQQLIIAANKNQPLLLDFYADWCISCKVMESQVFPLEDISSLMQQFHLVKADVTDNTEENKAMLDKFGLFGPPSILFFAQDGSEISSAKIVGEISKESYKTRLLNALGS